jgi:hypothetical protein
MPGYDLQRLMIEQERLDSRRDKLLDTFIQFREGVIEGLDSFAEHAAKAGLRGVEHCEKRHDTREFLEVAFTLNELDLVMAATDETFLLEYYGDLAAKIFIYLERYENDPPLFEVIVKESKKDQNHVYRVDHLGSVMSLVDYGPATKQGGQKAAAALISHVYAFQSLWAGGPSLAAIRRKSVGKSSIGFPSQK